MGPKDENPPSGTTIVDAVRLTATPARAQMKNRYGLTLQYDSENSKRGTFDANWVILKDKLAVRLMGNRVGQVVLPVVAGAVAAVGGAAGVIGVTGLIVAVSLAGVYGGLGASTPRSDGETTG